MPITDFANHDPDFTPEQLAQCRRIVDGLRAINTKIVRLGGSLEALTAAADRVEGLLAALDDVSQARHIQSFKFGFDTEHPNDVIPFNPATGEFNPVAPKLEMRYARPLFWVRYSNEFPQASLRSSPSGW